MAVTPTIQIDQATLGAGSPGASRKDGVENQVVTLSDPANPGAQPGRLWTLVSPTGIATTLDDDTAETPTFTPPVGSNGDTWLVYVEYGDGTKSYSTGANGQLISTQGGFSIPYASGPLIGLRRVGKGETTQFGAAGWEDDVNDIFDRVSELKDAYEMTAMFDLSNGTTQQEIASLGRPAYDGEALAISVELSDPQTESSSVQAEILVNESPVLSVTLDGSAGETEFRHTVIAATGVNDIAANDRVEVRLTPDYTNGTGMPATALVRATFRRGTEGANDGGGEAASSFTNWFSASLSSDQSTNLAVDDHIEFDQDDNSTTSVASVSSGLITINRTGNYLILITLGGQCNEGQFEAELRDNSDDSPILDVAGVAMRVQSSDNFSAGGTDNAESPYIGSVVSLTSGQVIKVDTALSQNLTAYFSDRCSITLIEVSNYHVSRLSSNQTTNLSIGDIVEYDVEGQLGGYASLSSGVVTINSTGRYYLSVAYGMNINEDEYEAELRNNSNNPVTDVTGTAFRVFATDDVASLRGEVPGLSSLFQFSIGQTLQLEQILGSSGVAHVAERSALVLVKL